MDASCRYVVNDSGFVIHLTPPKRTPTAQRVQHIANSTNVHCKMLGFPFSRILLTLLDQLTLH